MAEHKQRMESESDEEKRSEWAEKIEKWKKALTEVADIKGKEANDCRTTDYHSGIFLFSMTEIPTERLFETHQPKHTKHLLQGLNDEESLQLLSWHAFGRNEPNKGNKKELEKLLKSLKFLNLSGCHELVRVGHFSGLPQLERLTLAGCTSLVEICDTIGAYCQKLEVLDLSNCSKLKELPRSIGKLNNLIQLSIDGCSNIGENINMKSHESSSSTMKLYLDGNPIDSMPDCVRSLSRLETLSFSRCGNLKTVICAPIQLNHLEIDSCQSLERVTFNPELSSIPYITYYRTLIALTEIEHKFKIQALSEVDEEVLRSLGWISIAYLNHCRLSMANWIRMYDLERRIRIVPAQMLYEHGIFSTYLQGKEVPEWFTQRSSGSSFTLQSPPENGKIKGINVCIVRTISSMKEADPWRIKIRNLTKNSSWSYQPRIYLVPEKDAFEDGGEVDVIWLSHWMFGKNEFEDGDQVSIHFTVKYFYGEGVLGGVRYEPCVKVREYGMSTVYDDGGKQKKEDPLGYYKSWKYIIGGDLSPFEDF
ncbi:hypothetical protein M8C21_025548, partial [Ambrosia artemisiifolia]